MNARTQLHSRFALIASLAKQAQRMTVEDENVLDLIDDIDNELQEAIAIVNEARGIDAGAKTYTVAVTFTVGKDVAPNLSTESVISDEVQSWLESLKAAIVDIHVKSRNGDK